jgi:hypothetical protein
VSFLASEDNLVLKLTEDRLLLSSCLVNPMAVLAQGEVLFISSVDGACLSIYVHASYFIEKWEFLILYCNNLGNQLVLSPQDLFFAAYCELQLFIFFSDYFKLVFLSLYSLSCVVSKVFVPLSLFSASVFMEIVLNIRREGEGRRGGKRRREDRSIFFEDLTNLILAVLAETPNISVEG